MTNLMLMGWTAAAVLSCTAPVTFATSDPRAGQMSSGYEHLHKGELQEALEAFRGAAAVDLFESPNYEPLVRVAEVECLLGHRQAGTQILEDFRCMLRVDGGDLACYQGPPTSDAPGSPNPSLSAGCFDRMCSEIYLADYEQPTKATRDKIAALRREAERVASVCRQ